MARIWSGLAQAARLLASMRFAIGIMLVLALVALLTSLVPQHEAGDFYIAHYGRVLGALLLALGLDDAYGSAWFAALLGFLVLSVGLCVLRHTPRYLRQWRQPRTAIDAAQWQHMPWRAQIPWLADAPDAAPGARPELDASTLAQRAVAALRLRGWQALAVRREMQASTQGEKQGEKQNAGAEDADGADMVSGHLVAAQRGVASRKLGYIAAHSAIVLLCLGGLLDSGIWLQWQRWKDGQSGQSGQSSAADGETTARLPAPLAYQAVMQVREGQRSDAALARSRGQLLWLQLPFALELERFAIDYHDNGQPRMFRSTVRIHEAGGDRAGKSHDITYDIAVNQPLRMGDVQVLLASFEDGGSPVALRPVPLRPISQRPACEEPPPRPETLHTHIGQTLSVGTAQGLDACEHALQLEPFALRTVQVEDWQANARRSASPDADANAGGDARALARWRQSLSAHEATQLHDFGPSIAYRLRDASGQATEFHNLMRAVELGDGVPVYLLGVRAALEARFHYLRLPQDAQGGLDDFLRLSHALADASARTQAVQSYVQVQAEPDDSPDAATLTRLAQRTLDAFAGAQDNTENTAAQTTAQNAGIAALDALLQSQDLPPAQARQRADIALRMLQGLLLQLLQNSRVQAGLEPLDAHAPHTQAFVQTALWALDDLSAYPQSAFFALEDFTPVYQAVFQISRSPGKPLVFAGFALLVVGVWAMVFACERQLWLWLPDRGEPTPTSTPALLTMRGSGDRADVQALFERTREEMEKALSARR